MQPVLRWVGGKGWHAQQVRTFWDGESRIVEPFAGSAAISFALEPARALLNDANPHLVNFYRRCFVTSDVQEFDGPTTERDYYANRDWFNRLIREGQASSPEAAGLFYYLNSAGFNNLCRFNRSGEFNVPHRSGREVVPPIPTLIAPCVWEWQWTNDDFRDVMLEPDDLVYADPPYFGTFNGYTEGAFTLEDFRDLCALLREHPGRVIIMNSATQEAIAACKDLGYCLTCVDSGQQMQRSRGREDRVPELMATNFPV